MSKNKVKRKFKKVSFKLSYAEYEYMKRCIQLEETTVNKFVKKYLREGFLEMKPRVIEWQKQKQPKNQLLLFDINSKDRQSSMLADQGFAYPMEEEED